MSIDNKINSPLICLKTGSNAKIISYFDKDEVPYVKISMEIELEDTKFHLLKTIPRTILKINLVIINLIPVFKKTLEYQFALDQGLMREHHEYLHRY